jgi:TctA family transporter
MAARSATLLQYFLSRPICVVLAVLIIISIAVPILQSQRAKRKKAQQAQ